MAKYTCYFKHKIYCNIQQNLSKQITLHSAGARSEHYQTSKIELFSKIVNSFYSLTIFAKSSILDVWKGSEYTSLNQTIKNRKNKQTTYGKGKPHDGSFKASYISVFNHWKTLETSLTTESNNLPAKLALPYHPAFALITALVFFYQVVFNHPTSSLINNLIFLLSRIWCTYLQA